MFAAIAAIVGAVLAYAWIDGGQSEPEWVEEDIPVPAGAFE